VAAVAQATAVLLERVNSMDAEASALVESLRAGAGRLATDLAALEQNMGELYDAAASGQAVTRAVAGEQPQPSVPAPPPPFPPTPAPPGPSAQAARTPSPPPAAAPPPLSPPETTAAGVHVDPEAPVAQRAGAAPALDNGDVDSARLVALNMALNGEPREDAERYLAENYELADRKKLVDEVYAAIES
jgi:hypothetical protein